MKIMQNKNKQLWMTAVLLVVALFSSSLKAQVNIGSTNPPQPFSVLELTAKDRGLRLPLLSTNERDAITTPEFKGKERAKGLMIFNTDTKCVNVWNGTDWIEQCAEPPCVAPAAPGAMTVTAATLVLSDSVVKLNGTFTASVPAVTGATSYTWTLPTGLSAASLTTTSPSITITGTTNGLYDAGTISVTANTTSCKSAARNSTTTLVVGCGAYVAPGVWKEFMCYNLGADETVNPFTPTYATNGAYYQWGRKDPAASAPDATGADATPIAWSYSTGWFGSGGTPDTGPDDATKSAYDPCPAGYRVPTFNEWDYLRQNNPTTSVGTWVGAPGTATAWAGIKFGPALMLPATGFRDNVSGGQYYRGYDGSYWSTQRSTASNAYCLGIERIGSPYGSNFMAGGDLNYGYSIRCIAQ